MKGWGGFCPICKIYWGGFCPSQQKRVGGILSGGGFCPDTYLTRPQKICYDKNASVTLFKSLILCASVGLVAERLDLGERDPRFETTSVM